MSQDIYYSDIYGTGLSSPIIYEYGISVRTKFWADNKHCGST